MEEKNELDRLFVLYLMKELNIDDEDYFIKFVNSDSLVKENFVEYARIWRLLEIKQNIDKIDVEQELSQLGSMYRARSITNLNQREQLNDYKLQFEKKHFKYIRLIRFASVAATLIVLFGITWLLFQPSKEKVAVMMAVNTIQAAGEKFYTRIEKNVSGKSRLIRLQDGSEVLLSDKSELKYTEPFAKDKRDISLKGKARFIVAKDKSKPFTVFSGDISTTAIGTEFLVTNFENERFINVQLFEGKVLVKLANSVKIKLNKSFYLLPGQEFLYNKRDVTGQIRRISTGISKNNFVNKELANEVPYIPNDVKGEWYMFNNQSLPVIFDQLKNMYGVEIIYKEMDLQKLYFIGRFEKTDSLEYILKSIAEINKLTISKENNRYIIRK